MKSVYLRFVLGLQKIWQFSITIKDEVKIDATGAGEITLPEGVEMVMPGDHVEINVELINPVACDKGLRFAIREGGRTVGSGQITEILD